MNTTTQQDTQAAANKAAEEGGLPALPKIRCFIAGVYGYRELDMIKYAQAAIAADRASRQVANKAEVEPAHPQFDASKGIYWFSVLLKCARLLDLPDDEPIPSGVLKAVEALVATPPATTGASSVLTDERTAFEAEFDNAKGAEGSQHDVIGWYYFNDEVEAMWKAWQTRAEVAAQAGQVAVPGWKLVPVEPTDAMLEAIEQQAIAQCSVEYDSNLGSRIHFSDAAEVYADALKFAPSPAKESK